MPTEQELDDAYWSGVNLHKNGNFFDHIDEWAGRLLGPVTDPIGKAHQTGYDDSAAGKVK